VSTALIAADFAEARVLLPLVRDGVRVLWPGVSTIGARYGRVVVGGDWFRLPRDAYAGQMADEWYNTQVLTRLLPGGEIETMRESGVWPGDVMKEPRL
jgi:hypothetical protein